MPLFSDPERAFASAIGKLVYCNHFLPERIDFEREALGQEFTPAGAVWNIRASFEGERPNIAKLAERTERLVPHLRQRLLDGQRPAPAELELYQDLVLYLLYHRINTQFHQLILASEASTPARRVGFYRQFEEDYDHFLQIPGLNLNPRYTPEHMFASSFQVRRAFHYVFRHIVGASMPAARLRAAIWQSIFTRDMRRYQRVLYNRMGDFMSLIVGPSGTGKELVARAIALSRYIPFDPKTHSFVEDFAGSFHALNLSALSPTLIESELFGHRRGAFTGALEDRAGWLEVCRPLGTVFLDEVGEIDGAIQVKLLRVLQTRTFQRLGDTQTRFFQGKIIAATHRDLAKEMHAGRIRQDFYYRLCSDMIQTPSLQEIITQSPGELRNLVLFIAQRITDARPEGERVDSSEAQGLTDEVVAWIERHLGTHYAWPGNFRELEQCVRNILIRGEYHPPQLLAGGAGSLEGLTAGQITAEQLLRRYCTHTYAQTGSYEETARRLGIDRRTVKAKVDRELLEKLNLRLPSD